MLVYVHSVKKANVSLASGHYSSLPLLSPYLLFRSQDHDLLDSTLPTPLSVDGVKAAMFNNIFFRKSTSQAIETAPVATYIEVLGLMDDFVSLEEVAPGSEWSDVLAANWGILCETATPEPHHSFRLKDGAFKGLRGLFQASRSNLEVA